MIQCKSKFHYSRLNDAEQGAYNSILSAWEAHDRKPSFSIDPQGNKIDLEKTMYSLFYDNPGLFYVDFFGITYGYGTDYISLSSKFSYDDKQIDALENQLEEIVAKITGSPQFTAMDNYHKELALHDYLVKNVSYAGGGSVGEAITIVGALISGSAVCEGYAKAFKLLCDRAGLSCIMVTGMSVSPASQKEGFHGWNIVKLDKACTGSSAAKCTHVDLTWNSNCRGPSDTCRDYFNLTDEEIAKDHTWDTSLYPACTSPELNYYLKNDQCFESRSALKDYITAQAKQGNKAIAFRLNGKEKTDEQILNAAREAVREAINSAFTIKVRYNKKIGTACVYIS
jgi:hypothetical protein